MILNKPLFGTDGIRAKFGQNPLKEESLLKLGLAIGYWAQEKYGKNIELLIGHDTRESCDTIKHSIAAGLFMAHETIEAKNSIKISDAQVIPTPAVLKIISQNSQIFNFGIIITASHNPYQDNGIKIVDAKTGKLDKTDEDKITEIFYSDRLSKKLSDKIKNNNQNHEINASKNSNYKIFDNAQQQYISAIINHFKENMLKGKNIIIDCANGATYNVAPEIFKKLGASVTVIGDTPDGKNINQDCGSTHPQKLVALVKEKKYDFGFAFDGDGDRIAAVSNSGQIKDGDDILYIISTLPEYKNEPALVGTIMSNYGLELNLKSKGKELVRAKVGEKYVIGQMLEKKLSLGAEPSGHVIVGNYAHCGDGIFAALKTLEAAIYNNNIALESFAHTPQATINLPVKEKHDLSEEKYNKIILKYKNELKDGRVIVRYSGTENLLRIMAECLDHKLAETICNSLATQLGQELNK